MTEFSFDSYELDSMDHASLPRKIFTRAAPVLAAMSFSTLVALRVAGGMSGDAPAPKPQTAKAAPTVAPKLAEALPATQPQAPRQQQAAANPYGELFDPDGMKVGEKPIFAEAKPVGANFSLFDAEPVYKPEPLEEQQQVAQAEPEPEPEPEPAAPLSASAQNAAELGLRLAEQQSVAPLPPARPADLTPRVAEVEEEAAPRPPERPARVLAPRLAARQQRLQRQQTAQQSEDSGNPFSLFDKLLGGGKPDKGPQLAYAAPETGGALKLSRGLFAAARPAEVEGGTAVYNIAAHTVTLPSGETLEAHSGLGPYFDDPDHVHLRMRGATPPATYKLTLRESLFHGVQALRLTPLDSSVHGRSGLLAHTFMLGQRGDSNGCVSFRNYRAFLEAFRNGEVRKLKVVRGDG